MTWLICVLWVQHVMNTDVLICSLTWHWQFIPLSRCDRTAFLFHADKWDASDELQDVLHKSFFVPWVIWRYYGHLIKGFVYITLTYKSQLSEGIKLIKAYWFFLIVPPTFSIHVWISSDLDRKSFFFLASLLKSSQMRRSSTHLGRMESTA